jgi:hypothetical protein
VNPADTPQVSRREVGVVEIVVTYAPREKQSRVKVVTFKVDAATLQKIDEAAESLRMTRSELIRKAVMEYIARLQGRLGGNGEDGGESRQRL